MQIKLLLIITFSICIGNIVHAQEQTFKLKDGTVISGTIQEETELKLFKGQLNLKMW